MRLIISNALTSIKNNYNYDDTRTKQHNVREQETGYQMHG